jgi:N-acyl-L-homoserine lactone synthetase
MRSGAGTANLPAMIDLVLPERRYAHASSLIGMYHDRKRVFVDALGWDLPCPTSWLELDEFDTEQAVYLIARSPCSGRHDGSLRLLPSTGRHMLGTIFRELCEVPLPVGDDCWEISRLVSTPLAAAGTSIMKVYRLLALALVEFALLNSIRRYTVVSEPHRVPALLSIGWPVKLLGLPTLCLGQELQALQILVDEQVLAGMRSRFRISTDVLNCAPSGRQSA